MYVFASKGGASTNPDWYHNLIANPAATVEVGTETFEVEASEVTGEERDRIYARQSELRPQFAQYQANTSRKIPVFALRRKSA
jgi:deazaflavin-dependent oxidoreductase (nitroreductase family)